MNGIGILIGIILFIMFGPPVLFAIIGLSKRKTDKKSAKVFYIIAIAWLIAGGGICATILTS